MKEAKGRRENRDSVTNKGLHRNQVIRGDDPNAPKTTFPRQQDALEASATDENRTRIATSGNAYPQLPETSPWAAPPDAGFHPARDRIDPNDECSMTFGQDLSGKSTPAEEPSLPSPTLNQD